MTNIILRMLLQAALLAAIVVSTSCVIAGPARAADPACIEGDPAFLDPFDPTSGPYLRPNRDVKICSSALANLTSEVPMTCEVTIDGQPYATTGELTQRQLVTLTNPGTPGGTMSVTCSVEAIDEAGDPVTLTGEAAVVEYDPVPVPEVPFPLD